MFVVTLQVIFSNTNEPMTNMNREYFEVLIARFCPPTVNPLAKRKIKGDIDPVWAISGKTLAFNTFSSTRIGWITETDRTPMTECNSINDTRRLTNKPNKLFANRMYFNALWRFQQPIQFYFNCWFIYKQTNNLHNTIIHENYLDLSADDIIIVQLHVLIPFSILIEKNIDIVSEF